MTEFVKIENFIKQMSGNMIFAYCLEMKDEAMKK